MIKQIAELTLPELTLAMARHEWPDAIIGRSEMDGTVFVEDPSDYPEYSLTISIDWQTMGPLWEREADNYYKYIRKWWADGLTEEARKDTSHVNAVAYFHCYEASKSPESIARALLTMWYPQGIDLEAV